MKRFLFISLLMLAACQGTGPIVSLPPPPPPPPTPPPAFHDVGTLGDWTVASAMNDADVVVGSSSPTAYGSRPIRSQHGQLLVLDPPPGISYDAKVGWASSITQSGTIAGLLPSNGTVTVWSVTLWDSTGRILISTPLPSDSAWGARVVKVNEQGAVLVASQPRLLPIGTTSAAAVVDQGVVRWIGYIGDIPWTEPLDINVRGQVVGRSAWRYQSGVGYWSDVWQYHTDAVVHHPVLWDNGALRDLGVFGKTTECTWKVPCATGVALAINDRSEVVGYAEDSNLVKRPFLWRDGTLLDLGVFPGTSTVARAINSRGQIAGDGGDQAFVWDNGAVRMLGSLGGGYLEVTAMNDAGDVVGTALTTSGEEHAFVYTNSRMVDLGLIMPGVCGTKALAVTSRGDVLIELMMPISGICPRKNDDRRLIDFNAGVRLQRAVVWHHTASP